MAVDVRERGVDEVTESEFEPWCERFGDLHGLSPTEKQALRLLALHGYQDEEIGASMRLSTLRLDTLWAGMLGKTKTHSKRELQALLLRYVMGVARSRLAETS